LPDFYYPLKQAQGVAQFMNCSVQDAIKLAQADGETFNNVILTVRAEKLVNTQREKDRRFAHGG